MNYFDTLMAHLEKSMETLPKIEPSVYDQLTEEFKLNPEGVSND